MVNCVEKKCVHVLKIMCPVLMQVPGAYEEILSSDKGCHKKISHEAFPKVKGPGGSRETFWRMKYEDL